MASFQWDAKNAPSTRRPGIPIVEGHPFRRVPFHFGRAALFRFATGV
jgi:hypothetical protein